jgi:hypothetical protein
MANQAESTPGTPEQGRPFRIALNNPNTQRYVFQGLMFQLNFLTLQEAAGALSPEELSGVEGLRTLTLELANHLGVSFAPEQKRDMGVLVEEIPSEKWQEWQKRSDPSNPVLFNPPFAQKLAYLRRKHSLSS